MRARHTPDVYVHPELMWAWLQRCLTLPVAYITSLVVLVAMVAGLLLVGFAVRDRILVERRLDGLTDRQGRVLMDLKDKSHSPDEADLPVIIRNLRRDALQDEGLRRNLCLMFRELTEVRCREVPRRH